MNICKTPMRHQDGTVSACILPHYHLLHDSDHRDAHGHTAAVLVHQASIADARRVAALPPVPAGAVAGTWTS
jgi:hypothetical protein